MKYLLLFAFSCGVFFKLSAQDPIVALSQAKQAFDAGDYAKALTAYQTASEQFKNAAQWESYLECGVGAGNSKLRTGALDAAYKIFEDYIATGEKELSGKASNQLGLLYKGKASVYYMKYEYRKAEPLFKKALELRSAALPDNPDLLRDYNNLAAVYRLNDKPGLAIKALKSALELWEKGTDKDIHQKTVLYENLATNYASIGNYQEALEYINQGLNIVQKVETRAMFFLSKGRTLYKQKNYKEAYKDLHRALELYGTGNFRSDALFDIYSVLSDVLFSQGNVDSALVYSNRALETAKKNGLSSMLVGDCLNKMIDISVRSGMSAQADLYLKTLDKIIAELSGVSLLKFEYYQSLAHYHQAQGDFPAAHAACQQQLISLVEGFASTDLSVNPDEKQFAGAISLDYLTDALANKARSFYLAYKAGKGSEKELDMALQTLFVFDKAIDVFRSQSGAETGLSWSDLTLDAYENALNICWELWQATKNEQYKQHALYFSEKSKAMQLLEAFQNAKATQVAGLSEADLEREAELRGAIASAERDLYLSLQRSKKTPEEQAADKDLQAQIFDLKRQHEALLQELESKNPEYFRLKNDVRIIDLAGIRALLAPDQTLLEYFVGEKSAYVFKITASDFSWYALDITEEFLSKEVRRLRESIYEYYLGAERTEQIMTELANLYAQTASMFYQKLLVPAAPLSSRLLIVPAGALAVVPFDALLTETPQDPLQFHKHAYLVRKHAVSYSYSATLLREMRERQNQPTKGTFLAFAPEFDGATASEVRGERFALSPLEFNTVEVDKVADMLGNSLIFKNKEATEDKFHELASDYRIVHFATHGMARDKDPDFSLLAFTEIPDAKENEFLYVRELYNSKLNADLVVLSACETGLGKLYRGEGVASLARAFAYAGAKSIFNTLWSVNDQSTSQIIESFYKHLQQGKDKDLALQQAKIDYLDKSNRNTAAPFLWAPYIMVGDVRAMDGLGGSGMPTWMLLAGIGAVLAVGFVFMKSKGKREF